MVSLKPSERYLEHVMALRRFLFGRYARRNVNGQNRDGAVLTEEDGERIKREGAEARKELSEKYSRALSRDAA